MHFPQLDIIAFLGRGGMGVVYKARQKALGRLVALKPLAPERVSHAKFAERFTHEAKALAALSHPSIVTVYDFGEAGGFYYLLMEFVDGVNLRQAMEAGRFTPAQALAIVPPVCEALQYAHEHGIVHRDIKPENLLLDKEGRVKIADFGIAKILGTASPSVGLSASQPTGTPQYMAPEQKRHRATDHRADIYSLGVVLYEMLTGELPADKLQPPSKRVQVDVRIDEIVLRALESAPELRFPTAAEFRTQVEAVTSGAGQSRRAARGLSAGTWLAVGAVLVLAPLIAFLAVRARQSGKLASDALLALAEQKGASFGPVVERVIALPDDSAETCALNLASGSFVPLPEGVREAAANYFISKVHVAESAEQLQRWSAATGADLMLIKSDPKITLAFYRGGIAFPGLSFAKADHMDVARMAVETERRHPASPQATPVSSPCVVFEQPELDRDGVSKAVFFQTRDNRFGLLQIIGATGEHNRVRLRYKFLLPPDRAGDREPTSGFPDGEGQNDRTRHAQAEIIGRGGYSPSGVAPAAPQPINDVELKALSWQQFDQTEGQYWRALADEGRLAEAAHLIERYLVLHPELNAARDALNGANLHFHAAQCLAFAGRNDAALSHITAARHQQPTPGELLWNEYLDGTAAFLRRDKDALEAARDQLAAGAEINKDNTAVLERLLANFDKSYGEAYRVGARNAPEEKPQAGPRGGLAWNTSPLTSSLASSDNSPAAIANAQQLGIAEATRDLQAGIRRILVYGLLTPETGLERDEQTGYRLQRVAGSILSGVFQAEAAAYNYAVREHWQSHDRWNPPGKADETAARATIK